jgi:hypothetical protein
VSQGHLYRDGLLGVRARVGELHARVTDLEARLTRTFWETLPKGTREELAALREELAALGDESLSDLTHAEGKLAAYLDKLARLIQELPMREAAWTELPDDVDDPPAPRPGLLQGFGDAEEVAELKRAFTAMVRERAADAEVLGRAPSFVARFRERGCPFALRATVDTDGNGNVGEVGMVLVTSIPRALPRLVLRHESLMLSMGRALGLRYELEVGDPSFDGLFAIEGSRAAVTLYLPPPVQAWLLVLARFDVPTLEVEPEHTRASVRWRFEPAPKALDAAVRVLRAVREAPPRVSFTYE